MITMMHAMKMTIMNHHTLSGGLRLMLVATFLAGLTGCERSNSGIIQGYVEGEYVYVASPLAGQLQKLHVKRGDQVKEGAMLFELDNIPEKAAVEEAERRLNQSKATVEDMKKGRRPTEMAAIEAQLGQMKAALTYSETEMKRQRQLAGTGATSKEDLDRAVNLYDQNRHRVAELDAELQTAKLGQREDQIMAAEADMKARAATLEKAKWDLAQKQQTAAKSGVVFDTLYREGEWVAAGRPVVALLPPPNVKVRAFVPEPEIGSVHQGDKMEVTLDGASAPVVGTVSFVSPEAEYTPPVIYSRESRSKLVFMIELTFDPEVAAKLHPGQPVDVRRK
ncbi:HlyD family secretion protein [Roseimicrobium gellanilyticum]|uniref:HlyD family secretion protein n=2 Tax=Roseimicrobium gellanilyticum TaxID=748857 RepID=A0A366HMW1_9BACT|nr:HlyD family secretion protein [Roseimicrobium gellanilyticum]